MSFIATATREPPTNGHAAPLRPGSGYAMPWGRHKGTPIHEVPADYLKWALKNASNLNDTLRAEIERQLGMLPGSTKTAPEEEIRVLNADLNRTKAVMKLLIEERDELNRRLLTAETTLRALRDHARPMAVNRAPKVESLRAIVKGLYRKIVLKHHPDRGGNPEAMKVAVEMFQALDSEIEQWERS